MSTRNKKWNCKFILSIVFTLMLAFTGTISIWAQFDGGEGTEESPYRIRTAEHLNNVRNHLNSHFNQTENIDLEDFLWDEETNNYINNGQGWQPIGRFRGEYDGADYSINNLYINRPNQDTQALFGSADGGTIQNLHLINVNVTGLRRAAGLVASISDAVIKNCSSNGIIRGINPDIGGYGGTGGLVGVSSVGSVSSFIENSYTTGKVIAENVAEVGGLIGVLGAEGSIMSNCYSLAYVRGESYVGGLVGSLALSTIEYSYSGGTVIGNLHTGGLVGNNRMHSTINNTYSSAKVYGHSQSGGLVATQHMSSQPTNSYWDVEASGISTSAGGTGLTTAEMMQVASFHGWDFDEVWQMWNPHTGGVSYPSLRWQRWTHTQPGVTNLYAEHNDRSVELFWDDAGSRYRIYRNGILIDTINDTQYRDEGLENGNKYYYSVVSMFLPDTENTPVYAVGTPIEDGTFAGGSGSKMNPWEISNAEQLNNIRMFEGVDHIDKYFIQTADIDLNIAPWNEDSGWRPIGKYNTYLYRNLINAFQANYNGNGYRINELTIDRNNSNYQGLFGVTFRATIDNVTLTEANITGADCIGGVVGYANNTVLLNNSSSGSFNGSCCVGGLVGRNSEASIVEDSYSKGTVNGAGGVGGLVGFNTNRSTIHNSFSTADVNNSIADDEDRNVGGLVGSNHSSLIANSYSTGTVTGYSHNTGGLVGFNRDEAEIINSYSFGRVSGEINVGGLLGRNLDSDVVNSYWDLQTSEQEESAGGTGRTTEQMTYPYDEETYVEWDFEEVWAADNYFDYNGYPLLYWQPRYNPNIAINPTPVNDATNVPIILDRLSWDYLEHPVFANPVGFRVYFNDSGEFGEEDNFVWLPYIEEQERYFTGEILPGNLNYATRFYWKVVPTTRENGIGEGRDAYNCPVWSFRTRGELNMPDVIIQIIDRDDNRYVRLEWESVDNANSYRIDRASDISRQSHNWETIVEATGNNNYEEEINTDNKAIFYRVVALAQLPILEGMVLVHGGTFNPAANYTVNLSSFYISKYEVTQSEWTSVMGGIYDPNWTDRGQGPTHPAYRIGWFDAIEYCNRLSMREGLTPAYSYGDAGTNPDNWPAGWNTSNANHTNVTCNWDAYGYRLPTEMEWEFAARGGIPAQNGGSFNDRWAGTNVEAELVNYAWIGDNSGHRTHPVATKLPNELGLYDMIGNVQNWVWDIRGNYPTGIHNNPTGPTNGFTRGRRGGWWRSGYVGVSSRADGHGVVLRQFSEGFRVSLSQN